ncbi:MAG: ABC transporter ATP-binding protein [Oscillospiraceae bacterium]|nr:ABC transporter ATP-binding protein [Oscillospiraceae bacterium]
MQEKQTILSAKGLCKSFAHNGGQVHILSGMDLDIYQGDFTVIMGASGSGKSTLLYALSGMDRATAGTVIYQGNDLVKMSEKQLTALRRSDFGFIFQQMHLVSNLTLRENITVPGYLNRKRTAAETDQRADELLEQMGLSHIKDHLPAQCSGGEQQRCAVARAIIHEPELLFADEPTGALNKRNTTEVLDLLTALNAAGQSILMVTHDARAALRASRIIYISDGKVVSELTLSPYTAESEKHREAQVTAWLAALEW